MTYDQRQRPYIASSIRRRLAALALLLSSPCAHAAEYSGHATVGVLSVKEKYQTPVAGSATNDQQAALGRFYLDVTNIGALGLQTTFDVRDKYDQYGAVDKEKLVLVPANEPDLRQAAIKYPNANGRLFWSAGRFPIPEAGLTGNDGAAMGWRTTPSFRVGAFGGLVPRDPGQKVPQDPIPEAGIFTVLQQRTNRIQTEAQHLYVANSLVYQKESPVTATPSSGSAGAAAAAAGESATRDAADDTTTGAVKPSAYWYANAIYHPNMQTRYTLVSHLFVQPKAYLRNLWLSGYRQWTPDWSGTLQLLRLDLTDYKRQQSVRETLPASEYTQAKVAVGQKLSKTAALTYAVLYGSRGADSLNKTDASVTLKFSELASQSLAAFVQAGVRKNFRSDDRYARIGVTYYGRRGEVSLTQELAQEKPAEGDPLNPKLTDVAAMVMLTDTLFGGLNLTYVQDERVTITSAMATLSLRFDSRQLTPLRNAAPPVDVRP